MMPVQACRADDRPGYRWGGSGKCYTYAPGDDRARREAKRKATVQGIAAGEKPAPNGVKLTAELQTARDAAEARYLAPLLAVYERAIRDAGEAASEQFAITAAADWQPPAEGAALTALRLAALSEALKRNATPIWRKVLLEVAAGPIGRIGIAWDVKHPLFAGQIEKAAQRTGVRLGEAVQPVLRKTIADAYDRGLSVPDTSALIRSQIADAAPWQADMLARTDLNSLSNGASKSAAKLTGMEFKTWLATLDEKTRPEHADAHGQTVSINDPFVVGGEDADFPGDPSLSDAMAANCRCVSPSTPLGAGPVLAGLRRVFEGHLVRLTSAAGREVSVTPNHPILTRRGWVPAGELVKGDDLICCRPIDQPKSGPDIDDMPATAEERFTALEFAASRTKRVRGLVVNLHGEIPEGEVDVVWSDDDLPLKLVSPLAQKLQQAAFALAQREMRLARNSRPLCSVSESSLIRSASASRFGNASTAEDAQDRLSRYAKSLAQTKHARPTLVGGYDGRGDISVALVERDPITFSDASTDASAPKMVPNGHRREAAVVRDLLVAHPGLVQTDPLIDISREDYAGHVYNFTTDTGTYTIDGIISANCTLAYGETLDEAEALLADGGTKMAHMTHRQRARKAAQRRGAKVKRPAKQAPQEALVAGAVAVHHTAVVAGTWDGNAAMGRCSSAADYRSICAAFENGADLSLRQSWHLPHHANPNGPANINGVRNALGRAPQTTSISSADRAGATAHLRAHLNDYNKRQGNAMIEGLDEMSLDEALAAMDEAWGQAELVADVSPFEKLEAWEREALTSLLDKARPDEPEQMQAKLPAGMDSLPDGVSHCQMNGTPGFSGGRMCHMHNGSPASMKSAMRKAQSDARGRGQHALLAAGRPVGFHGAAVIEGRISDDNSIAPRVILPDSLAWPELPVPFMAQTVTAEGHAGAEVAGRVDEFKRTRGTGKLRNIDFFGELTTPFGIDEIAPMIEDKTLRYVSADLGASEWALVDRKTLQVVPQEDFDLAAATDGAYALGCTSAKIKAVTLVPTQAIEGAMVALTAAADRDGTAIGQLEEGRWCVIATLEAITSHGEALTAAAAPTKPPALWFETPEPPGKMPLTISENGRVFGHLATWDSCHVGFLPQCVPPPKSDSSYAYFHVCELDTADGDPVTVGKLMFSPSDGGHADRTLSAAKASAYYDRTGMAAAFLRVVDGQHGIWAAGVLNPDLSDEQRQEMRRQLRLHPPSGDWRPINGQYELICALAVAVPGYPTPRATISVTASAEGYELQDAIIASSGVIEPDLQVLDALAEAGLLDEELEAERQMAELAARASWRDKLSEILKGDR